jgi:hypothetical protein
MTQIFDTTPLERVRAGMVVLSETGVRLGTVKRVRMGEPQAVTTAGETPMGEGVSVAVAPVTPGGSTSLGGSVPFEAAAGEEADVPEPLRTRLRRVGFIELDGSDLHGADRYIPGDRIRDVTGDTVHLGPEPASVGGGSAPPSTSAQPATPQPTSSSEPSVAQTYGETPEYASSSAGRAVPTGWQLAAASAGAGAIVGTGAGIWLYRRRQQARPQARLRRQLNSLADSLPDDDRVRAAAASGLLLTLLAGALARRVRGSSAAPQAVAVAVPAAAATGRFALQRQRPPALAIGLVVGALALGVGVWRNRRAHRGSVAYIGTPGVESASGRDRIASGELPADLGCP